MLATFSLALSAATANRIERVYDRTSGNGSVSATIFYPSTASARALIVFGHCTDCDIVEGVADWYTYLAPLAAPPHNFVLAFPGSHKLDMHFSSFADDLALVRGAIAAESATNTSSVLFHKLAAGAPALGAGHSLGGASALIAAGAYPGVFASVMSLSGCIATKAQLAPVKVPTFLLTATADCMCPPKFGAEPYYAELTSAPTKYVAEIVNGTHCHFVDEYAIMDGACSIAEAATGAAYNLSPLTKGFCEGPSYALKGKALNKTLQVQYTFELMSSWISASMLGGGYASLDAVLADATKYARVNHTSGSP